MPVRSAQRGQATVEIALMLPFVAILLLAVVQVGVVVRGEIATVNAARAGARAGAVHDPDVVGAATRAAGLPAGRTGVVRSVDGDHVTVTVVYDQATDVPLIGLLVPDVRHEASVTMRLEPR